MSDTEKPASEPSGLPEQPGEAVRADQAATPDERPGKASAAQSPGRSGGKSGGKSGGALWLALLALLVALGGPFALWKWDQRNTRELARRVQSADERANAAEAKVTQALDQVRDLRTRTELAEAKLAEAAGQQAQLEKLYKSVAVDSADALLAELESALSLAAQQLASGGSAEAALLALKAADGRLARLDDPGLVGLRRAIARDIERLRSATSGDIGVLAGRLDALARDLDDWPLIASAAPASGAEAAVAEGGSQAASDNGWRRWLRFDTVVDEFASLFRVRRVDAPDAALIAPDQAYFLRENLRLRLLNARLDLLSRNDPLYRSDIDQARTWIERYFDRESPAVRQALAQLGELRAARATDAMPSVTDSLGAVRAARAAREAKE